MKSRLALGILFLVVSAAAPAFAQKEMNSILEMYSPAVVSVVSCDREGKELSRAGGFLLNGDGEIVTTYHNVRGAAFIEVSMADGRVVPVESILAEDPAHDLVLLSTGEKEDVSVSLPTVRTLPALGKLAIVIGSPPVSDASVLYGTVSRIHELPSFGRYFRVDTLKPSQPGSLVVNVHGQVIGVTISHGNGRNGSSVAVPFEVVASIKKSGRLTPLSRQNWEVFVEPTPAQESYFAGMRRIWEGRFINARSFFEDAVKADSSYADAWFMLGYCSSRADRHHVATEAYRQALRFRPEVAEAHFYLGGAYGRIRCFQDAAESYERAALLRPDDVNTWFKLAMAYGRLDWDGHAKETFRRAVCVQYDSLTPDGASCSDLALDRFAELMDAYVERDWMDDLVAEEHFQRGLTFLMLARIDLSLQEYEVLKKIDSKRAAGLYELISP